jgi:drug/metabolite transporter (DMT)-like permease
MTAGTVYALAAMVCYGLGDFIFKRSVASGVKPLHFLTAQAWIFCPLSLLYAAATGTIILGVGALWGGLAGLFLLIGFNAFLRSLATGPVSINAPIFRLSFLITAALAIVVLGEPVTAAKFAGLALALVAIWLLLGGRTHGTLWRQSLVQVAIATVALGIGNFCHKLGLHFGATPETGVAAQAAVFCSLTTLITLVGDRGYRVPLATWKHSVPAALVLLCAFLFLLHALAVGPASVLVPIAQMGFIITAGLGVVLLGEPLTPRKLVGLAAAIAALAVLAWT